MRTDQELAACIGLDWGDQRHAVQIQAAAGGPVDQLELAQQTATDPYLTSLSTPAGGQDRLGGLGGREKAFARVGSAMCCTRQT